MCPMFPRSHLKWSSLLNSLTFLRDFCSIALRPPLQGGFIYLEPMRKRGRSKGVSAPEEAKLILCKCGAETDLPESLVCLTCVHLNPNRCMGCGVSGLRFYQEEVILQRETKKPKKAKKQVIYIYPIVEALHVESLEAKFGKQVNVWRNGLELPPSDDRTSMSKHDDDMYAGYPRLYYLFDRDPSGKVYDPYSRERRKRERDPSQWERNPLFAVLCVRSRVVPYCRKCIEKMDLSLQKNKLSRWSHDISDQFPEFDF